MAVLKLPLAIGRGGFFERSKTDEEYLLSRLKIFLLSGSGRYLVLPSPAISVLWQQLTTIGSTSRFKNKNVFPEDERRKIEERIRDEANIWLEGTAEKIRKVEIMGDETTPNGIKFMTREFEFIFQFEFAVIGDKLRTDAIGNWNITERINVIY